MHEIITLQFGQQANYVGTHYWNTQESYFTYEEGAESQVDHDRSFRQGIGVDGVDTYTPRALVYDLKNAFGSLRRDNELYDDTRPEDLLQSNAWGRQTSALQLPPIVASDYQQALNAGTTPQTPHPSTIRYWSDYNHVFYHPRSMVQLSEYEVNSSLMPFERYDTGETLFDTLDKEHDILDRDLRPFLEECDQLQAINIIASTTDAWGGFAAKYTEQISDDLGKGSRWVFGLEDNSPADRARQSLRLMNTVQCLDALTPSVSLNLPLKTTLTSVNLHMAAGSRHPWQTSALQATALETLTLATRLKHETEGSATAPELEQVLNLDGHRSLTATGMVVQDRAPHAEKDHRITNGLSHDAIEDIENEEDILDIDMFPSQPSTAGRRQARPRRNRLFSRLAVLRQYGDSQDTAFQPGSEVFRAGQETDLRIALAFPILTSYPQDIFTHRTNDARNIRVTSSTSERVAWHIRDCATASHNILPLDVREGLYDGLMSMAEQYEQSMSFADIDEFDDDD